MFYMIKRNIFNKERRNRLLTSENNWDGPLTRKMRIQVIAQ